MTTHAALRRPPANLVNGEWREIPGDALTSTNPARPSEVVWSATPDASHLNDAVAAARAALPAWARTSIEQRIAVLRRYKQLAAERVDEIAGLLCDETGKAMWECVGEAKLLAGKVDITLEEGPTSGRHRVDGFSFGMNDTKEARCHFRPHGVMAVLGPFNFPAHLPNGHIVPALLTGNTIVFKPSDKTPAGGQALTELFDEALRAEGAPAGVINMVQGAIEVAAPLTTHADIDGVLFTGSWPVGRKILESNLDHPGRMIALEMGGNNAAVVMDDADLFQAAAEIVRCAFNTTGQRCTCTRRVVVHEAVADRLIGAIVKSASTLVVDDPRSPETFMGPIINEASRSAVFAFEKRLAGSGGRVLVESTALPDREGWYVTPSVVEVDSFNTGEHDAGCDLEVFGPLVRIARVSSLDAAIEQANATRYGLASSIFTKDTAAIDRFLAEARAGCVNVNCGTAGASSKLPFGGLGWSGNHRPAGAFSLDYTAYPVASMIETGDAAGIAKGMRLEREWLD